MIGQIQEIIDLFDNYLCFNMNGLFILDKSCILQVNFIESTGSDVLHKDSFSVFVVVHTILDLSFCLS